MLALGSRLSGYQGGQTTWTEFACLGWSDVRLVLLLFWEGLGAASGRLIIVIEVLANDRQVRRGKANDCVKRPT
jgi:hypothetical protein